YCDERDLPVRDCGKLIVALDSSQIAGLRELERRATANGVPGLRWVEGDELGEIEPHAAGVAGLHSPSTGITDYRAIAGAFADDVRAANGELRLSTEVTGIRVARGRALVDTDGDTFEFDRLAVCAGLYSDRLPRPPGD